MILERYAVDPLVEIRELEMEIPDLGFPFDASGEVTRFRHRRCRLRQATLRCTEAQLAHWLADQLGDTPFGHHPIEVRFLAGQIELTGGAAIGAHATDFVFRGFVQPIAPRQLRVCLSDLVLFAPFPLPAPLLAGGLLRAIAGDRGPNDARAQIRGCSDLQLDPLTPTLLHALVPAGWRVPAVPVQLLRAETLAGELTLCYGDRPLTGPLPDNRHLGRQQATQLFEPAEQLVLTEDTQRAIAAYRDELERQPEHPFIHERLLQLLAAEPARDEELLEACSAANRLFDGFVPAIAAEAVARERRGETSQAAALFGRLAETAESAGLRPERALAILAAGRCALAAGERQNALDLLERAEALLPDDPRPLQHLARLHAQGSEWRPLAEVRRKQILRATEPSQRLQFHLALAEVYRVHLARPDLARAQYECALQIDGDCDPALQGLAEAAIDGDQHAHAIAALDRLCAVAAARDDRDTQVAAHQRIASIWLHLGDRQNALARLQRARALSPADPQIALRTAELLTAADQPGGDPKDPEAPNLAVTEVLPLLEAALERKQLDRARRLLRMARAGSMLQPVDESRLTAALATLELDAVLPRVAPDTRPKLLAGRGRLLARLERQAEAEQCYQQALAGAPDLHQAHAELGELLFYRDAFETAIPHLQIAADRLADPQIAGRAALLAGQALDHLGRHLEAIAHYEQAIDLDPTTRPAYRALVTHYEKQGDWDRLGGVLTALVSTVEQHEERQALLLQLATVCTHQGSLEDARRCLAEAVEAAPDDRAALRRLREICQRQHDWPCCAEILEREIDLTADSQLRGRLHRELGMVLAGPLARPDEAIDQLQIALEHDETDEPAAAELLPLLEIRGHHRDAARLAQRIAQSLSGGIRRKMLLRAGRSYEAAGWLEEARFVYRQISSGDDEISHEAAARLLDLTLRSGSDEQPADTASSATAGDPAPGRPALTDATGVAAPHDAAPALADRIEQLVAAGDWEGTADALRGRAAAVREPASRAPLLVELGRLLEDRLERPFDALDAYHEATMLVPDDRAVLEVLADSAYRHQDWRRAQEAYDRLSPLLDASEQQRLDASYRRGVIYEALAAPMPADRYYAKALAAQPSHRPALEARARLALYRDDVPAAIEMLGALTKLLTSDELDNLAELRQQLGELHLRQDSLRAARECLEGALALDSRLVKSMQLLLAVYERLGDHSQASAMLGQLISHTADPLVRASLLHHRAEILASHLHDEEQAVDCLLKAYDIAPNHVPTLWRLVDYFWTRADFDAVAEIAAELSAGRAFEDSPPDRRHVRVAVALSLACGPEPLATRLLAAALADEQLVGPAMLDLGVAVHRGIAAEHVASLLRAADDAGAARTAAKRILRDHPEAPGLEQLVTIISGRPPAGPAGATT